MPTRVGASKTTHFAPKSNRLKRWLDNPFKRCGQLRNSEHGFQRNACRFLMLLSTR